MPQTYTPEFKKKIVVSIWKKDVLTKASPLSMAYQKPASLNGVLNLAKNARQKPF